MSICFFHYGIKFLELVTLDTSDFLEFFRGQDDFIAQKTKIEEYLYESSYKTYFKLNGCG